MILQSLNELYDRMVLDPDSNIARAGYSMAKVDFALILSEAGDIKNVVPLYRMDGTRKVSRELPVPSQEKRTSSPISNFLCDNPKYVLGWSTENPEAAKRMHMLFSELHRTLLAEVDDPGARAILAFVSMPEIRPDDPVFAEQIDQIALGGNLVFMLEGDRCFLHQRPVIAAIVETREMEHTSTGQCAVTGKTAPIARLHPSIKGVAGAQSSGANIVSFNQSSFESYAKTQSFNAPVSQQAAFAYTTMLNHLLRDDQQRMRMGDTTVVIWADQTAPSEQSIINTLFGFNEDPFAKAEDPQRIQTIRSVLEHLQSGRRLSEDLDLDNNVGFHILGLSPNASRLSVRFYMFSTFGVWLEKLGQHYQDADIRKRLEYKPQFPSIWQMLRETAVRRELDNIPNSWISGIVKSLLTGTAYPEALFTGILTRIRADHDVNPTRAAILKACLLRKHRLNGQSQDEEMIHLSLNLDNIHSGYLLGRLFAVLEKAQIEAVGGSTNATIRDRYMSAAAATPAAVFPQLLRLAGHHFRKLNQSGGYYDRLTQNILNQLCDPAGFPKTMNSNDQGLFYLGYYQQRQDLYTKRTTAAEQGN